MEPVAGATRRCRQHAQDVQYTMRDALYTAGMLNVFQRQSKNLTLANLAQMVNVLPLIVTNQRQSYATPIYYPFEMYRHMEPVAMEVALDSPVYESQALGNIEAHGKSAVYRCFRHEIAQRQPGGAGHHQPPPHPPGGPLGAAVWL